MVKCPVCLRTAPRFQQWRGRPDERCGHCKSLRRHRADWLYWTRVQLLGSHPVQLLHTAPELGIYLACRRLRRRVRYTTCDLRPAKRVRHVVDIQTCARYPDNHFDHVYSSHVLEHVADANAAMASLLRVTKQGGTALLHVPLRPGPTLVHPGAVDDFTRTKYHGQKDHLRWFGKDDYHDHLAAAGWRVRVLQVADYVAASELRVFGVSGDRSVYECVAP